MQIFQEGFGLSTLFPSSEMPLVEASVCDIATLCAIFAPAQNISVVESLEEWTIVKIH